MENLKNKKVSKNKKMKMKNKRKNKKKVQEDLEDKKFKKNNLLQKRLQVLPRDKKEESEKDKINYNEKQNISFLFFFVNLNFII